MFRLSGAYFYRLAQAFDPVCQVTATTTRQDLYARSYFANAQLAILYNNQGDVSIRLRSSRPDATEFENVLQTVLADQPLVEPRASEPIGIVASSRMENAAKAFRTALLAELSTADFYAITQKGAYDTTILAEQGEAAFPRDLTRKLPKVLYDVRQAARCLAFDLPTATAFHAHRANEAVVHAYFAAIAPKAKPPKGKPLGAWIAAIENCGKADPKVVAALRDLKDLHRNPVAHPEHSLENAEEAIALLGAINTAMTHMLKAVPVPA